MKVLKSTLLNDDAINVKVESKKINLNGITNIVNELNSIMAPIVMKDVKQQQKILKEKLSEYETKLKRLKNINKEVKEENIQKESLIKQLKVLALLGDMHGNYVINDKIKHESLIILNELPKFSMKRLDAQIEKLNKVVNM